MRLDCTGYSETTLRITCGRGPISRLTRTRRARARSRRRQPVASSPFQKSAVRITVTTASPRSHDAASIQLKPTVPPVRSTRLYCGALLTMSETLEHWSGVRRGLTRGLWALLFSFRLFSRHHHLRDAVSPFVPRLGHAQAIGAITHRLCRL